MTAVTMHRPPAQLPTQRGGQLPTQRGGQAAQPPVLRLVAPTAQPVPAVHLTGRGRVVVLLALVAVGVSLMLALTGLVGGAAAGTARTRPATRTIVVQPGQTLWSIAREVAPGADRRETIARIMQLNALPSSGVSAGERIAVPTH